MSLTIVAVVAVGLLLLVGSVALRSRSGNRYELKPIDLALLLLPPVIWLTATGKIQKLAAFGVEFEVAQAFVDASNATVELQVTPLEETGLDDVVEAVRKATKGGVDEIPRLIASKTQALGFHLGAGNYWGPAIQEYFESLLAQGYLRFVLLYNSDGSLYGMYPASGLLRVMRQGGADAYKRFAADLNSASPSARERLSHLPDFIPAESALQSDMSKRDALQRMEEENLDMLPVVDDEGRFLGTVSRSKLAASLVLDVAQRLES